MQNTNLYTSLYILFASKSDHYKMQHAQNASFVVKTTRTAENTRLPSNSNGAINVMFAYSILLVDINAMYV